MAFEIPGSACTLAGFREWSCSDEFPEHGTISFVDGEIWIDMSPERIYSHNRIKTEETRILATLAAEENLGEFYSDRTRLVNPAVGLSTEPDGLFVAWDSFKSGRAKLIPAKDEHDFIEIEGTPDWVSEVVSPSSEKKDMVKLLKLYYKAGISEYWLIDARRSPLTFQLFVWTEEGYEAAADNGGWCSSPIFGKSFRWRRQKNKIGQWTQVLEMK